MSKNFHTADALARTLAKREVDPNEVAKCFTHLRDFLEAAGSDQQGQQQATDRWWTWLETVAGPAARTVVRSNRTRGYYADLLDACQLHLANLDPAALSHALGWAVRLMRYYRNVQGALAQPTPFTRAPIATGAQPSAVPQPGASSQPKKASLPQVGDVFTAKVLEIDERAVFIEVPGFTIEQALGMIKTEALDGRRYRVDNNARVEVVAVRQTKSGRMIIELKPAPRGQ
jgi:hypothetical protein